MRIFARRLAFVHLVRKGVRDTRAAADTVRPPPRIDAAD